MADTTGIENAILMQGLEQVTIVIGILICTYVTAKVFRGILERALKKPSRLINVDTTHLSFMKHFLSALVYTIGIGVAVYTVPDLKDLSISIFAGAGVLAVILGFASQQAFSNIVSGIFISIFEPLRVGDTVRIHSAEVFGIVEDITLRHTVIRTFENNRIVIPNSVIGNEIIENASLVDEKVCKFVDYSVSFDSDIDRAMQIIQEEAIKNPYFIDNRRDEEKAMNYPKVHVRLLSFTDSAMVLRAGVWAENALSAYKMGCDLNKAVKQRFDAEGIEMPHSYRTILYKKDMGPQKNA
ncbi:MAG: mechanosensitive ion channel family protein [Candidatus Altiarchaeia archaeon]